MKLEVLSMVQMQDEPIGGEDFIFLYELGASK